MVLMVRRVAKVEDNLIIWVCGLILMGCLKILGKSCSKKGRRGLGWLWQFIRVGKNKIYRAGGYQRVGVEKFLTLKNAKTTSLVFLLGLFIACFNI
jgi:hypothetical protein